MIKVLGVTPGRDISIEEARPMLEAEIRKDQLAEKVYAQTQAYDDAHQGGSSLADAAQKAGAVATTLGPITQQGIDQTGRQLQGLSPKILELAFSLPAGGESEVTELGDGAYFAVRVEKIVGPHVPPLAELRPMVTQAYMQREIIKRLEERASALQAQVRQGQSLEAVASAGGYALSRIAGLTRQSADNHKETSNEVLGRAFSAKAGEVWTARAPNGIVVGRVVNVRMDPGPQAAQFAEANRGQLTAGLFQEMAQSAQVYARTKLKVKTNATLARSALGFEPVVQKDKTEKKK